MDVFNPYLAANMRRLMNGRSIGGLRAEMAEAGLRIGQGTIARALNGQGGNRLQSLEKLAQFFRMPVEQLLQPAGADVSYWPFSDELQRAVLRLDEREVERLEGVMRAHLGLPPTPLPAPSPPPMRALPAPPQEFDHAAHEADLSPPGHSRRRAA